MDDLQISEVESECNPDYVDKVHGYLVQLQLLFKRLDDKRTEYFPDNPGPAKRLLFQLSSKMGKSSVLKLTFLISLKTSLGFDDFFAIFAFAEMNHATVIIKDTRLIFSRDFEKKSECPTKTAEVQSRLDDDVRKFRVKTGTTNDMALALQCNKHRFPVVLNTIFSDLPINKPDWNYHGESIADDFVTGIWPVPIDIDFPLSQFILLMGILKLCKCTSFLWMDYATDTDKVFPSFLVQYPPTPPQEGPSSKRRKAGY